LDGWPAPLVNRRNIMTDDAEQALQQLLEQEGRRPYADGAAITENGRQRQGAATFDAAVQDVTAKLGNAGVDQLVNLMVKKPPTSPLTSSLSPATIGPLALASRSSCRVRGSPGRKGGSKVKVMAGERVVFTEENNPQQYLKLVASGEVDDTLLEALGDYVKRQRKRLKKDEAAN
jgi:hypothetical protein